MIHRRLSRISLGLSFIALAAACSGCMEETRRRPAREPAPVVERETPTLFRNTVGALATLRGTEPTYVSGFGLVVGLAGTGGGPLPAPVQATMERELAIGGIGKGGPLDTGAYAGMTPRQVLADPSVAVVVVDGVIPPGAPDQARFDVRVSTLPGSSVTSLEGGKLWTAELRLGNPSTFGATRARKFAEAKGQVFINPFANSPGGKDAESDGITRTVGRIMAGGVVTDPLALELLLDNASHTRAAMVVAAINARFPVGPGDDGPCAKGRNDSSIAVRVPRAYRDHSAEFVKLLQYTPIDSGFAQEHAKRYVEELTENPGLAEELSWALIALGKPALPFIQPLYDSARMLPRMAALRAGARLGDLRTVPHLRQVATSDEFAQPFRSEAILLMGELPFDPSINLALRSLVNSPSLETRVAAYETLADRGDPTIIRTTIDNRFSVDVVPCKDDLVYITQQGEPRIVIFGDNVRMNTYGLVSVWGDRLSILADPTIVTAQTSSGVAALPTEPDKPLRVRYVNPTSGSAVRFIASDRLADLIRVLGSKPRKDEPASGLGLTYSQVVGVLYQMQKQKACDAAFTTEENRLIAAVLAASDANSTMARPESDAKRDSTKERVVVINPGKPAKPPTDTKPDSLIVRRKPGEKPEPDAPSETPGDKPNQ